MTPRHADVMFVLEGVPGVLAVYALAARHEGGFDLAIEVSRSSFASAAHYALLRVLSYEECGRILYRVPSHGDLLPRPMVNATRLSLTSAERELARMRVGPLPSAVATDMSPSSDSAAAEPVRRSRRLTRPPSDAPFSALVVDLGDDVHESLRTVFRGDARHRIEPDQAAAAETALTRPFHIILCSAPAALGMRGFLARVASEDRAGGDGIVVVAPARDVPYVKWNLARWHRKNPILATPIDDTLLRHEAFREHVELFARAAAAEVAGLEGDRIHRPCFRRFQVLVIDEELATEILFSSGIPGGGADVALATNAIDAFEHVVSRDVDLVLCSATLRADGGEPFYRVLWRLSPGLKRRTVLVTPPDAVPASAPRSSPARFVERPLRRETIARVIEDFTRG
ncbi:MAG: hypothetical protein BGO98_48020 [Myxococcales bacterium 68-20]|nr:hypothetical protein [Myxococcales bacterium]OJY29594.1 MAG: hypothetical protein BGO98_48020 [Myxococcales bacterium 68-20]